MMQFVPITTSDVVALRKESVDRNMGHLTPIFMTSVALRKESVDRNKIFRVFRPKLLGRSPQGERG